MAQNMKLSIISQGGENVIVEVNENESFEEFQQKVFRENNLCITIEDFQLFFENLSPNDNFFNCLKENLNIGSEVNNAADSSIYEIDLTKYIKDEDNNAFTITEAIGNTSVEHFDAYKDVQNLDTSLLVLNQDQASEYSNILNDSIFESSDYAQNTKKTEESNQQITECNENNDITNNYELISDNQKYERTDKLDNEMEVERNKILLTTEQNEDLNENSKKDLEQNNQEYNYLDIESKLAEMHEYNEEIMTDVCRLCAKNIGEGNKIQIYDENNESNKLEEKINESLPIKIKQEDGLPQQICNSCIEKLKNCHEFVQIVLQADVKLRQKFVGSLNDNYKSASVSEFVSEFLGPSSVDKNDVKFELEEPNDNNDIDFETEYLDVNEVETNTNNERPNCRLCDLITDDLDEAINHGINAHHINDLFACIFCELGYPQSILLQQHMRLEHRNLFLEFRKYQCTVCLKKYSSQYLLQKHTCARTIANTSLHCEICNKSFPTKVRLNFHRQFHLKDPRPLHCTVCNITFDDENEFFDHVNFMHESDKIFPCNVCNKTFSFRAALNNHKKVHTGVRNYSCNVCDKSFLDKQTLKEHKVSHMDTKPYQCHICGKNLNRISRLKRHLLIHESDPEVKDIHVCDICKEAFADASIASYHKISHPENKNCMKIISTDKVFRCEFCDKCYSTPIMLNKHRHSHSGPNPYICHICKAQFSTYARCTTHKNTHGLFKDGVEKDNFPVVKHFLCEHCGKSYIQWSYLSLHRRLKHSENIQLYKCLDCKLQFPNSWGLAYHRKTKHSLETFKCPDCEKVLSNEQSLKLHRFVKHISQKPKTENQCLQCGKNFALASSLDEHMKIHPSVKEYKCSLCPKTFYNLQGLSNHLKIHRARKFVFPNEPETPQPSQNSKIDSSRPFVCDICGLCFRRQFTLRSHKQKHLQSAEEGSFILMVDMKEDEESQQEQDKIEINQSKKPVLVNKPVAPEMNYLQLASDQQLAPSYIDIGNGNYLQIQGNTFNIDGKEYILVDENGKTIGRNEGIEMVVDETLPQPTPMDQTNMDVEQQFDNNTVMYVEADNNTYVINQNDVQSDYVFATADKTAAKPITAAGTTYVIGGNEFLLQTDDQTF